MTVEENAIRLTLVSALAGGLPIRAKASQPETRPSRSSESLSLSPKLQLGM